MRAIIVDDDLMSQSNLSYLCGKIAELEIAASFTSALEALEFLKKEEVDVIFLDIEMPEFSGLDLVKNVKDLPQVVFITSKSEYALEAFEHQATDYIQKPVTLPRLQKTIERLHKVHNEKAIIESDYIFIRVDGRLLKVNLKDILYIETLGDYVVFVTEGNKKHIVHSTLKGLDSKLKHPDFVKVHRSYIVNISKIVDIEDTNLVIADKVIPISRAHKTLLMSKIKTF